MSHLADQNVRVFKHQYSLRSDHGRGPRCFPADPHSGLGQALAPQLPAPCRRCTHLSALGRPVWDPSTIQVRELVSLVVAAGAAAVPWPVATPVLWVLWAECTLALSPATDSKWPLPTDGSQGDYRHAVPE